MQAGLVPDAYIGMGNTGVGCFKPAAGITNGESFKASGTTKCFVLLRRYCITTSSSKIWVHRCATALQIAPSC